MVIMEDMEDMASIMVLGAMNTSNSGTTRATVTMTVKDMVTMVDIASQKVLEGSMECMEAKITTVATEKLSCMKA